MSMVPDVWLDARKGSGCQFLTLIFMDSYIHFQIALSARKIDSYDHKYTSYSVLSYNVACYTVSNSVTCTVCRMYIVLTA